MAAADPDYRRAVARLGAMQRWRGESEVLAAQRDLRALRVEKAIRGALAAQPPITDAQREHLAAMLRRDGAA